MLDHPLEVIVSYSQIANVQTCLISQSASMDSAYLIDAINNVMCLHTSTQLMLETPYSGLTLHSMRQMLLKSQLGYSSI